MEFLLFKNSYCKSYCRNCPIISPNWIKFLWGILLLHLFIIIFELFCDYILLVILYGFLGELRWLFYYLLKTELYRIFAYKTNKFLLYKGFGTQRFYQYHTPKILQLYGNYWINSVIIWPLYANLIEKVSSDQFIYFIC